MRSRRAVFLDRDGVINRALVRDGKPYPPSNLKELEILPGVKDSLERLRRAGCTLIVVTNQPDVARGATKRQTVELINSYLAQELPIDDIRVCYHDDCDGCACRKPKPGAILDAANDYSISLGESFMVGDRWRDIEAGRMAGCKTIFIDYGYREKAPAFYDYRVMNLSEASSIIEGDIYGNT